MHAGVAVRCLLVCGLQASRVARSRRAFTGTSAQNHGHFRTFHGHQIFRYGHFHGHILGRNSLKSRKYFFAFAFSLLNRTVSRDFTMFFCLKDLTWASRRDKNDFANFFVIAKIFNYNVCKSCVCVEVDYANMQLFLKMRRFSKF